MRARFAKWLVHFTASHYQASYEAYVNGSKRRRTPRRAQRYWAWQGALVQRAALPLAKGLDEKAAIDQMILEAWWG